MSRNAAAHVILVYASQSSSLSDKKLLQRVLSVDMITRPSGLSLSEVNALKTQMVH